MQSIFPGHSVRSCLNHRNEQVLTKCLWSPGKKAAKVMKVKEGTVKVPGKKLVKEPKKK